MPVVALQVLQLLFGVGIVGSFLWAIVPFGTASEQARTRRRAEWLSIAVGLLVTYLLLVVVRAATGRGGPDPLGMIPFLTLAVVVVVAVPVLRAVWRSANAARTGAPGAAGVEPEPERHHRGLSGEEPPPTRW